MSVEEGRSRSASARLDSQRRSTARAHASKRAQGVLGPPWKRPPRMGCTSPSCRSRSIKPPRRSRTNSSKDSSMRERAWSYPVMLAGSAKLTSSTSRRSRRAAPMPEAPIAGSLYSGRMYVAAAAAGLGVRSTGSTGLELTGAGGAAPGPAGAASGAPEVARAMASWMRASNQASRSATTLTTSLTRASDARGRTLPTPGRGTPAGTIRATAAVGRLAEGACSGTAGTGPPAGCPPRFSASQSSLASRSSAAACASSRGAPAAPALSRRNSSASCRAMASSLATSSAGDVAEVAWRRESSSSWSRLARAASSSAGEPTAGRALGPAPPSGRAAAGASAAASIAGLAGA
mmetsp:Transcript_14324/g.48526  ORF Transcript_14324/g.48526 Transcript_14324/m.48526 type:complete len:348 (+) Transcript_14324:598-1641(+)